MIKKDFSRQIYTPGAINYYPPSGNIVSCPCPTRVFVSNIEYRTMGKRIEFN